MTILLLKILSKDESQFQVIEKDKFDETVKNYEKLGYDVKIIGISEDKILALNLLI